MSFIKNIIGDAKALLRGERRIGAATRGRVYARKDGGGGLAPQASGSIYC